jgi:hypothetical protein
MTLAHHSSQPEKLIFTQFSANPRSVTLSKVDALRDSHKLFVTRFREFEQQFWGKTVQAGMVVSCLKNHI